ncbi:DNA-binding transcriptional LysR family regulator [Stella humosa]|uniref:DNA-binding transcriptional LysR family regulator n=1 Tax=Stella humosa TaxID=94 RepID=A0A3N1L1E1_9PROT|nr:LysR family transcriptional regulator [Stella humosa]ROP83335.1 DNA-binding transcriptional LysR family regulator [Stella humosa]
MPADWSDLRVFLTLAREGSLTAAARQLDVSHPTVARRIKALEDSIGARLFDRLPDRFVLTSAGEELLTDVKAMDRAAESIHRRSAGLSDTVHGTVRLSADEAMADFIARHLPRIRHGRKCVEIELVASHQLANLSRREADLMIRQDVPEVAGIVTRKLGRTAHAVYARPDLVPSDPSPDTLRAQPWIGFDEAHVYMPGQRWMMALLDGLRPAVRVNNWLLLREAARTGSGLAVLPCFMGDADPWLHRIGPPIEEAHTEQWLLVHRDLRVLPRIRGVMDAIVALFQAERMVVEGRAAVVAVAAAAE